MIKFISFFIPTIKHNLKSCEEFFYQLEEETQEFLEELDSYYLLGLSNYSIDGCLSYDNAQQLLEEHDVIIDDYIEETKDDNLTIINLIEYLGY